jgi:uncharacterized protein
MNIDIRSVTMEVASGCNLQCSYCYNGALKKANKMSETLAKKSLDVIFNICKSNEIKELYGIGFIGGEPLLNFNLIRYIVERCKHYKEVDGITTRSFSIVTNGTLLNDEIIDYADKNNIHFRISLDGNKTVHNKNRSAVSGRDYYNDIIKNIKKIDPSKYVIRATITKEHINDFQKNVIDCFNRIGAKRYSLSLATSSDENIQISCEDAEINAKEQVEMCFYEIVNEGIVRNDLVFELLRNLVLNMSRNRSCNAGRYYIGISHDGKIVPCHRFFSQEEFSIGNVESGIDKDKVQLFESSTIEKRRKCIECSARYICNAHCYHDSIYFYNDINRTYELSCAFKKKFIYETFKNFFKLKRENREAYSNIISKIYDNKHKYIDKIEVKTTNKIFKMINKDSSFKRNPSVELIDLEQDGIFFFKNQPSKRYLANTTTMAFWDIIDGTRTAQQIAHEIANVCEVEFETIKDDIYGQLAAFQELGLVEEVQPESHA